MVTNLSGMPPIVFEHDKVLDLLDQDGIRSATHVHTDPVTGVALVSVFHDDGSGYGKCIMSFPLSELRKLAADYAERLAQ